MMAPIVAAGIAGGTSWGSWASFALADTTVTLTGLGSTNDPVPVDHGSNAEATVTWDANWDQYPEWDGRGDVYQVDQPITSLSIAPKAANIRIGINQFELDEWAGGGDTSARWSVTGSDAGLLASGVWDTFNTANDPANAGGRSVVAVNVFGTAGESLTLAIDHTDTGSVSYLAMDNLVFSTVVVPEPASAVSAWLGISGLGALAMRRKKSDDGRRVNI